MNLINNIVSLTTFKKIFVFAFLAFVLFIYLNSIYHIVELKLTIDYIMFYHAANNFFQGKSIYLQVPWQNYHFPIWLRAVQYIVQRPITGLGLNFSNNLNPPVFTLLILPLGLLPVKVATIFWCFLLLAADFLAIKIIYDDFFREYQNPLIYWVLLGGFLASMPAFANLDLGQVGTLTFLGVIWLWRLAKKNADVKAGLLLGFLLSIKYFLGLLWILFLLQRRWKIIGYAIGSFVILNVIGLFIFGKETYFEYLQIMQRVLWYANNWNASLFGFFSRLAAKVINLHFMLAPWAQAAYYFCSALLLLGLIKICYKPFQQQQDFDYAFAYSLVAALLICPLGWIYYFPLLLLPISLVLKALVSYDRPLDMRPTMAFIFMLGSLSCPSLMQGTIHVGFNNLSFTSSGPFYGLLILLGLLFFCKNYLVDKAYPLLPVKQQYLVPWAVIAYLTTLPALTLMFYCDFIRVPRIWE